MTFEKVLDVFSDYLIEDEDCEVLLTRHGYAITYWDYIRKEWPQCEYCESPEVLCEYLLDDFARYTKLKITDGDRDLTAKEVAYIEAECERRKALCETG